MKYSEYLKLFYASLTYLFSSLSKQYGSEDTRTIFAGIEEKVNLWKEFQ